MAKAITTIQMQKKKKQHKSLDIALTTYHFQKLELVGDSQLTPCLCLPLYNIC